MIYPDLDMYKVLELVESFVSQFEEFSNKASTGSLISAEKNIEINVRRKCNAIIMLFSGHINEEESLFTNTRYRTKQNFLDKVDENCEYLIEMARHDKRYFDSLKIALVEMLSLELVWPKKLGIWLQKCINNELEKPKGNCIARKPKHELQGERVTLILYVLKNTLGLKPTINDATRDKPEFQDKEYLCGADYLAKVLKLKYKTIVEYSRLREYENDLVLFEHDLFRKFWMMEAEQLLPKEIRTPLCRLAEL